MCVWGPPLAFLAPSSTTTTPLTIAVDVLATPPSSAGGSNRTDAMLS